MGRSSKSSKKKQKSAVDYSSQELYDKAEDFVAKGEFDLAQQFYRRILEAEPTHAAALEMYAVAALELDDEESAKNTLLKAASLPNPAPSIYLYLAQISDATAALEYFATAYKILSSRLTAEISLEGQAEIRRSASRALIGMTELYLTDLCFEVDAESKCDEYLQQAIAIDPSDSEAFQTLASVRLSQHKTQEAISALQQSWAIWKDEPHGSAAIPPFPSRLALAKLFIETSQFLPAYEVLVDLENEDDEDAAVQYLLGLNLFLKLEPTIDKEAALKDEYLRLGNEAAQFLASCLKLQAKLQSKEAEDQDMVEHATHMLSKLLTAGVSKPREVSPDAESGEEWQDQDSDDAQNQDVEMAN